jgi:ribosomal protein S18 acetylase RimI-like enzyme
MDEGVIRHPAVQDVSALVDIYIACFPDRVKKVFGGAHRQVFIWDYLRFYLAWDPKNNWIYALGNKVLGCVIAPCRYGPAKAALVDNQVWRWFWHFSTGQYGFPFHIIKLFLTAGFAFDPDPAIARLWGKPYIHIFAVTPNSQGGGIGSQLMRWTLDRYRSQGIDYCWLIVQSDNPRGIGFYQRFGFRIYTTTTRGDIIMVWSGLHAAVRHC